MFTPELTIASITLLLYSLLLVLALLRWRLKERVIFHLAVYTGLGFLANLWIFMSLFDVTKTTNFDYKLATEFTLLAMILSFGALTLSFMKKSGRLLLGYWGLSVGILMLWQALALNFQGGADRFVALLAGNGLIFDDLHQLAFAVSILGWGVSLATVLVSVPLELRKRHPTQFLNRLRYWLIITILLAAAGLSLTLSPNNIYYGLSLVLLVIAASLASYNILSYQTPDLKLLVGRGIRYMGVTIVLSGLTALGLVGAVLLYQGVPDSTQLIFGIVILAVVLGNLYRPIFKLSYGLLTRLIFGKTRADDRQLIRQYSKSISSNLNLQRLADVTVNSMVESLNIDRGIVFVNNRQQTGEVLLKPYAAVGINDLSEQRFQDDNPFISCFRQKQAILSQYDIDVLPEFQEMSPEERDRLAGLGIELYAPVLRDQHLLGVLAFGSQPQGTPYNKEEQDLMMTLANQAGLAFEGARLFQKLSLVNEEVGALNERLTVLDQSKSDFLSIASHELRTPLTQIHTYSQVLLDLTEDELKNEAYVKQVFEGLARGSERMKDVIDTMLDVSAADLGTMNLFVGPVNLAEVYDQAVRPFSMVLEERQLELHEDLARLPIVEADGTRLVQAFENLLGNAIKYTPDGGTIKVSGRVIDADSNPAVEVSFADGGIGIDPEYHEPIFDKFFRADDTMHHSTSKTKFKGAGPGLGLTLVKAIAKAHQGQVWVESSGRDEVTFPGSTFFLVVPLQPMAEAAPEPVQHLLEAVPEVN